MTADLLTSAFLVLAFVLGVWAGFWASDKRSER